MAGCDCGGELKFDGVSTGYMRILWVVIAINASMFLFETGASVVSNSMALRADALDFLGDSLTYGITLLAIGRSVQWRASAAIFKGVTLICMGLWVLGSTLYRVFVLGVPNEVIMGSVALLAFAANMVSVLLLLNYRDGDANVRSVWLCSRNDAIGNLAVMVAAGAVFLSQSHWPDLLVAFLMSMLFLHSATLIIRQARREMNHHHEILINRTSCSVAERD
ncbi:MAG: cation transporter [gamma proteobacterium symbiont of Ctena orbiculata]|uniref:Cation transporter n=1 Tax=Candidatus Thiodiazotropha taylori TaxID=2792791 RepID=A0A944M6F6_9GAMM|nr:cation transporter [Candidatus Thiodiazotropha taylori]PUB89357.1 MAG: cation transporter [gamma proteobacterium symbiont of Ctena orbiculata]MBT2987652.1 cation transporter [Candidatus Thiodiazotropha taylori]MBT2995093.1 cation transporter [Candidatus Thiodiazotropha taylori]MBT2999988.1 cation transporter [Candidatus Thiodiazotropha taylori]